MRTSGGDGGVLCEVAHSSRPTRSDFSSEHFGFGAQLLQAAMLVAHPRPAAGELLEPDFDFHQQVRVEFESVVELPAEYQTMRRVPDQYLAPRGLVAIGIPLEPAAMLPRFHDQLGVRVGRRRLAARPPSAHVRSKKLEGSRRGGLHIDTAFHGSDAHLDCSFSISASAN